MQQHQQHQPFLPRVCFVIEFIHGLHKQLLCVQRLLPKFFRLMLQYQGLFLLRYASLWLTEFRKLPPWHIQQRGGVILY